MVGFMYTSQKAKYLPQKDSPRTCDSTCMCLIAYEWLELLACTWMPPAPLFHQCLEPNNFLRGSLIWNRTVSIMISKKVTAVDGPSVLRAATGMLALANISMAIAAADATSKVPCAPNRRKSSRKCNSQCTPPAVDALGYLVCKHSKHLWY